MQSGSRRTVHRYGSRLKPAVRTALDEYLSDPRGRMSDRAIRDALEARFRKDAPSEDTVTRARGERDAAGADPEWSILDPEPALSPSALARVLEVLAVVCESSTTGRRSLTRGEADTIARLEDATRGMDAWDLFGLARFLLSARRVGDRDAVDAVQLFVGFQAWTRDGARRYHAACGGDRMTIMLAGGSVGTVTRTTMRYPDGAAAGTLQTGRFIAPTRAEMRAMVAELGGDVSLVDEDQGGQDRGNR